MRLVYLGDETVHGNDGSEGPDPQVRGDRRRMALVALAAVGLGVLLVYVMALGGGAHEKSSARPKAEPVFGYVVREVKGPGLKR